MAKTKAEILKELKTKVLNAEETLKKNTVNQNFIGIRKDLQQLAGVKKELQLLQRILFDRTARLVDVIQDSKVDIPQLTPIQQPLEKIVAYLDLIKPELLEGPVNEVVNRLSQLNKSLDQDLKLINAQLRDIKFTFPTEAKNPISVRLSNGKEFYDAITQVFGGGGGGGRILEAIRDTVSSKLATDSIMDDKTALTPKFAFSNVAASTTDGNIVSAVSGKKIRVISFRLHTGTTATNVTFNSKPAGVGTAISELFACAANGGRAENFSPVGHFETTSGQGLTVTTGTGSTTGVGVVYVEV